MLRFCQAGRLVARHCAQSFTVGRINSNAGFSQLRFASAVSYQIKDGVAVIKLDVPNEKMNSLSEQVSNETKQIYNEILSNSAVEAAVIMSGKPDNFVVGADVRMIKKCKKAQEAQALSKDGQDFFARLESSSKPIVSAIMGPCLGGGLELAMATQYRIAVKDKKTKLGLPEVMLGLLPGAGGTQRLPQLINIPDALQMMLTGKQLRADKAKKLGLVDLCVDPIGPGLKSAEQNTMEYLETVAVQVAKDLASGKLKVNRTRPFTERLARRVMEIQYVQDNFIFKKAKDQVLKMTNGLYPAPLRILDVVKTGLQKGPLAGYEAECKAFGELAMTTQSNALLGLFAGQTHCKKNKFGKPSKPIKEVGILGAGLMGAGIASVSVDKGYTTFLKDANQAGLARGVNQVNQVFANKAKRKTITNFEKELYMANLVPTLDYNDLRNNDIVIEAVFEDLAIKHKVVRELEAVIKPDCIFASNTSALPIAKIAEASKRPQNVVGMHYFSPVDKMQLLEIITTDQTSEEATKAAVEVGLKQGKLVIVVKDSPAFYTTRILAFFMAEAYRILQETGDPRKLDQITKAYGFPVGSATLMDEVGMDVGAHIGEYLVGVYKDRIRGGSFALGKELIDKGFYGRKAGKGWFLYDAKKKGGSREVNPEAVEVLKRHPLTPQMQNTDEDLQLRLVTRFVNEAVLCLEEGVLKSPLDGDIGAVFGLGFPPCHGGPFRFIDQVGADRVVQWMDKYANAYGSEFEPCQLLRDHAKDRSKRFHSE